MVDLFFFFFTKPLLGIFSGTRLQNGELGGRCDRLFYVERETYPR